MRPTAHPREEQAHDNPHGRKGKQEEWKEQRHSATEHWDNAWVQRARAVDSTQVKTADRGLRCNPLFVGIICRVSGIHRQQGLR